MSLLAFVKMSLVLIVFLSAQTIWAFEYNSMNIKPYSRTQGGRDIPNLSNSDEEYVRYLYSLGKPYQSMNRKVFVTSNEFGNNNRQNWKRNGDLINSLLGLPHDMMLAGR